MTALDAAASTDPGQVRAQNQDTYYVSSDLVLIADGMGGYAGGEVAAAIAAEVMEERFTADTTAQGLSAAVQSANRRIYERGVEPGLEGMGTTLVAVAVVEEEPSRLLLANVGDSRCYLLRAGALRQLTEDHSVAAELVRLGRIDEEEGAEHPGRHVLTRALGVDLNVEPDLIEITATAGDRLLLCSDGLSNELGVDEIVRILQVGTPSDAARALVAAANAHGGLDNITAVVADVTEAPEAPVSVEPSTSAVPAVVHAPAPTDAATGPDAVRAPPALALRPVLSRRERSRRRREDRRERRAWNKWVSFRGAVFMLAIAAVLVGGYAVLRWYATSNYIITVRAEGGKPKMVVLQGRAGGFLLWNPKVAYTEPYGPRQLPTEVRALLVAGIDEPTLADAKTYLMNNHNMWLVGRGHSTTGSTTTTFSTTGGT